MTLFVRYLEEKKHDWPAQSTPWISQHAISEHRNVLPSSKGSIQYVSSPIDGSLSLQLLGPTYSTELPHGSWSVWCIRDELDHEQRENITTQLKSYCTWMNYGIVARVCNAISRVLTEYLQEYGVVDAFCVVLGNEFVACVLVSSFLMSCPGYVLGALRCR